jgi:prepilin-type N-terminal cleavage/methylation domain-containing protein
MKKKGFTLTELTVVIGILSIIVLVVAQPITNIIKYQRESQQSDNVRDNVQFILNVMDKELRTSSNLSIDRVSGALTFTDQSGVSISYKKEGNIIKKSDAAYTDASVFIVENLDFYLQGVGGGPGTIVTVFITAKSVDGKDMVTMQSTTMPRNTKTLFASTTNSSVWQVAANTSRRNFSDTTNTVADFPTNFSPAVSVSENPSSWVDFGWISNNSTASNGGCCNWTQFVFRQKFDLTEIDLDTVQLKFQLAADDWGDGGGRGTWKPKYRINNGPLIRASWPSQKTDEFGYSITIDSTQLIKGINTIDFYIQGNGETDGMALKVIQVKK